MAKFGKLARLALPFKADLTETQDTMQPQGPDLRWAINSGGKAFEKARHCGCVWSPRLAIENTASKRGIRRELINYNLFNKTQTAVKYMPSTI